MAAARDRGSAGRDRAAVRVSSDRGVVMISVAAELADMHPQTLRMYEARGLIEPKRSPKGTRLYSHDDVQRLRRIQEMTATLGLNLAGVERVLELETELESLRRRVEELEAQAHEASVRAARELEALRRSLRMEIVPYRTSTALVPATRAVSALRASAHRAFDGRDARRGYQAGA